MPVTKVKFKMYTNLVMLLSTATISVFSQTTTIFKTNSECSSEAVTIPELNEEVLWEADYETEEIHSNPICLGDNLKYQTRECVSGSWRPFSPPKCTEVLYNCEKTQIHMWESCIFISEPTHFENTTCPLGFTLLDVESLSQIYLKNANLTFWLPITKKDVFMPFEYTILGDLYGLKANVAPHFNENCAILKKNITGVKCDSKHRHVCISMFPPEFYQCRPGCVASSPPANSCYCMKTLSSNQERTKFCKNLAKIDYSLDIQKIKKNYSGKDPCWITTSHNVSKPLNKYPAISKYGLSFQSDRSLKCAICREEPLPFEKVEMILKFYESEKKLLLTVHSFNSLFEVEERSVYCFTDASVDLKKRIKIKEIFSKHSTKKHQIDHDTKVYKLDLEKRPGRYWCEGFELPNLTLVTSNTVIAYKKQKGQEYSLRIRQTTDLFCNVIEDLDELLDSFLSSLEISEIMDEYDAIIKPMKVFAIEPMINGRCFFDVLFHITSTKKKQLLEEYDLMRNILNLKMNVVDLRSSYYCMPDISNGLSWRLTTIGVKAMPLEFCVQENGLPVTRICLGDFLEGGFWSNIEGSCSNSKNITTTSENLHSLFTTSNKSSNEILKNVSQISKEATAFTPLDVVYLANILKDHIEDYEAHQTEDISETMNNVMAADIAALKIAQENYNSTDDLLRALDYYLEKETTYYFIHDKIVIQKSQPFIDNISGLAIYGISNSFLQGTSKPLYQNSSLQEINTSNLQVATFIDFETLAQLTYEMSEEEKLNTTVTIVVFFNDSLFISDQGPTNASIASKVVSVSISGFSNYLPHPIPVLIRSSKKANSSCVFWDYSSSLEFLENKTSHWSSVGGYHEQFESSSPNGNSLQFCEFTHLTHFALLILSDNTLFEEEREYLEVINEISTHNYILTYITIAGCSLSIAGAFAIFSTAIIFESWRERLGSKLLVNLAFALFFEIVVTQVAGMDEWQASSTLTGCTIIGIILQYSVLAKFFWMLISAFLQYLRFIRVFQAVPEHFLIKSIIVGWGFPLVPTLLVAMITPDSYGEGTHKFCYPKGLSLYLGVFLPIVVIAFTNSVVFWLIMYNIQNHTGNTSSKQIFPEKGVKVEQQFMRKHNKKENKKQICLAILLFFLLGIPWVFGILAEAIEVPWMEIILSYLFCAFATLQGFVLFIFYIVLDRDTNQMWKKYFRGLVYKLK